MTYLADQKTFYFLNPNLKVWATPTQVRWSEGEGKPQAHPREGVRDIILHDKVHFDSSLIKFASKEGKVVSIVDGRFNFLGWFVGPETGKGNLRLAQYEFCRDGGRSSAAARQAVLAKITGQFHLLKELGASDGILAPSCPIDQSVGTLLGVEGAMANAYFNRWTALLAGSGFDFPARRRRPAPDPVNALYDLYVSLLANEIFTFCCIVGLDPYVGFYHVTTGNRPSLVADLIEEWRAPIVDKFVLRSLRRREFLPDDFEMRDGACRLKGSAWGKAMTKWNEWYLETVRGENAYRKLCYRDLVEAQVRHFARVCLGDDTSYIGHNVK